MSSHSGWRLARAQFAWILALVISTAIIVRLERVDFGATSMLDAPNPFGTASDVIASEVTASEAAASLAAAEAAYAEHPDDTQAGALLLIALSVATHAGVINVETAAARAAALIDMLDAQNPLVRSGRALAAMTFGLVPPPVTAD